MAMAAVRPLGGTKARTVAAVPSPPSLAERLAEARRAAEGPARRVGELESALKDALDRKDYTAAQGLNDELAEARQESAIATAAVTGLQAAIAEIEARQAEDGRAIAEQRQRDEARRRCAEARQMETELDEELNAGMAAVLAGIEAVRPDYQRCLQLEFAVGQARAEQLQARVVLGEISPGQRATTPNRASVLADSNPVIRELVRWGR